MNRFLNTHDSCNIQPRSPLKSPSAERAQLRQLRRLENESRIKENERNANRKSAHLAIAVDSLLISSPQSCSRTTETEQVNENALQDLLDETECARQSNQSYASDINKLKEEFIRLEDRFRNETVSSRCHIVEAQKVRDNNVRKQQAQSQEMQDLNRAIQEAKNDTEVNSTETACLDKPVEYVTPSAEVNEYMKKLKGFEKVERDSMKLLAELAALQVCDQAVKEDIQRIRVQENINWQALNTLKLEVTNMGDQSSPNTCVRSSSEPRNHQLALQDGTECS